MFLETRDVEFVGSWDDDDFFIPWWHTKTGLIVKWAIIAGIIIFILLFVIGGYLHAQSRISKGLPPLAYHRFLVKKNAQQTPPPGWGPEGNPPPNGYYMNYMPPPPVYDPSRPPQYSAPPDGNTKIDPSQWRSDPTRRPAETTAAPMYGAPSGPPPPTS